MRLPRIRRQYEMAIFPPFELRRSSSSSASTYARRTHRKKNGARYEFIECSETIRNETRNRLDVMGTGAERANNLPKKRRYVTASASVHLHQKVSSRWGPNPERENVGYIYASKGTISVRAQEPTNLRRYTSPNGGAKRRNPRIHTELIQALRS